MCKGLPKVCKFSVSRFRAKATEERTRKHPMGTLFHLSRGFSFRSVDPPVARGPASRCILPIICNLRCYRVFISALAIRARKCIGESRGAKTLNGTPRTYFLGSIARLGSSVGLSTAAFDRPGHATARDVGSYPFCGRRIRGSTKQDWQTTKNSLVVEDFRTARYRRRAGISPPANSERSRSRAGQC